MRDPPPPWSLSGAWLLDVFTNKSQRLGCVGGVYHDNPANILGAKVEEQDNWPEIRGREEMRAQLSLLAT